MKRILVYQRQTILICTLELVWRVSLPFHLKGRILEVDGRQIVPGLCTCAWRPEEWSSTQKISEDCTKLRQWEAEWESSLLSLWSWGGIRHIIFKCFHKRKQSSTFTFTLEPLDGQNYLLTTFKVVTMFEGHLNSWRCNCTIIFSFTYNVSDVFYFKQKKLRKVFKAIFYWIRFLASLDGLAHCIEPN